MQRENSTHIWKADNDAQQCKEGRVRAGEDCDEAKVGAYDSKMRSFARLTRGLHAQQQQQQQQDCSDAEQQIMRLDELTMGPHVGPTKDQKSRKRKRSSLLVNRDQKTFLRLWVKFISMFSIPADSRFKDMSAPLLVLCMGMASSFCSWAMSICSAVRNEYGIDLNPADAMEGALLLVHAVAAAKANVACSDLYTVRNSDLECSFAVDRFATMYTSECVGTNAMLLFLYRCVASLYSFDVHKRFLLGAYRCTDPTNTKARCPKRRQEAASFYWLHHAFTLLPVSFHSELVNILNRFWLDNGLPDQQRETFSLSRNYLLHNETFSSQWTLVQAQQAAACQRKPRTRRDATEVEDKTNESPYQDPNCVMPTAIDPLTAHTHVHLPTTRPAAIAATPTSPSHAGSSSSANQSDCPLATLASSLRVCKEELVDMVMSRAMRLCQRMSGFYHPAIDQLPASQPARPCSVPLIPQLQGNPQDVLYLNNEGQFEVRPSMRSEDVGCPIS